MDCATAKIKYGVTGKRGEQVVTIPVKISEELAKQLIPLRDYLPDIIKVGLAHWRKAEQVPLTPRQQVERLWAEAGLVAPLDPTIAHSYPQRSRQPAVQASGRPASQIVIEQRGDL